MLYTKCVKTVVIEGLNEAEVEINLGRWIEEQDESPVIIQDEKHFRANGCGVYYIRVRYVTVEDYNKYHVHNVLTFKHDSAELVDQIMDEGSLITEISESCGMLKKLGVGK